MINNVARTSIINLRGGGCGSTKVNVLEERLEGTSFNRELPSSLLSITQAKVKSLQSKKLTISDKSVQDEYLNTISWLDINEYWYQRIPSDKSNMTKCIKLLQFILNDILEIVESILDGSRFIGYSLIRVANNFSRIMVVYYTQNEGTYLDLKLSNELKERITSIKEMIKNFGQTALYYNGLEYESRITEACINICPVDDPEGRKLGLKALVEIVKSAASFSPSEDLFSSLGDLVVFGVKSLYQKYKESNFKEMMTKCLFIEQFKWTIVTSIEKQTFSISSIFNTLAKFYKNEVLASTSWEVKYCWIKANHFIMGYKVIITKDMLDHQQIERFDSFWYQLSSEQLIYIIDRSDHNIGATINENRVQSLDLRASNPLYSKLLIYTRQINRIKTKLLNGSEKLPKILHYHQEFSDNKKSNQNDIQILELQNQLQYFDIENILNEFAQIQSLINNLIMQFNGVGDLIKDFHHQNLDQDQIADICQQSTLIATQLQQFKQMIINLRIKLIQFGIVADNFSQIIQSDSQLQKDHIEQKHIIQQQIIMYQIYTILIEYQTQQINDSRLSLNHQDILIKQITRILEDLDPKQPQNQQILAEIKIIRLHEYISKNCDITKPINQIEKLSSKLIKSVSIKHLDIIQIMEFLSKSKTSLNDIDRYLVEIQSMNILYSKLSFIPNETLKADYAQQRQNIIQYSALISIQMELNTSYGLFKEINTQFKKILSNKLSFDRLYLLLNKVSLQLIPKSQQNRLIIEEAILLKYKNFEISKALIQSDSISVQSNQSFEHMAGVLDIQNSLIQQQQEIAQQLQQIVENSIFIDKVQKEDSKQNDLLLTLKQTLEQTINIISEVTLIKFKTLLEYVLKSDEKYQLKFHEFNVNLEIQNWQTEELNEELFKQIRLPEKQSLSHQQGSAKNNTEICENLKNNVNTILKQIESTINNQDITIIRSIITNEFLNSILINCTLPLQTIENLIAKFTRFNKIGSKFQIQIDILVTNLVSDLKLIKNNIDESLYAQEHQASIVSNHEKIQRNQPINLNLVEEITLHKQGYQTNYNYLRQIIEFNTNLEDREETTNNQQIQKMEQLTNMINTKFKELMNLEILIQQNQNDQVIEVTLPKQVYAIKFQKLLELINITQDIDYNQMRKCLQQNQKSIISLEQNKQTDGEIWRLRECQLFNILITQQRLIIQYQAEYSQELIVFKATETDNRIQKILKSSDFLILWQNTLEKYWKQQASSIQTMISSQLGKLQQLQKQIQSQQPGPDRDQLFLDHQALETQIDEQIENVSSIGNSLGTTIAFIKDLKKELLIIQDSLKEINSKLNDMSLDIKFLIGKSPQQLLEIRMEKILKQKLIDDARSVYVELYTKEMKDFNKKEEAKEETPLSNTVDEQNGEIDEFIKSQKQKSLLVHGPAGSGKSTAAKKVEEYLWAKYKQQKISNWDDVKEPPIIPIFIQLPTLKDPKFRALQETLKSQAYLFNDKQIMDLQKYVIDRKIKLFIIMDSYDELNSYYLEQNLNVTNKFDQWCENSHYQILNTTRSEIFTTKTEYRTWFTATSTKPSPDNFKEIRLLSFNDKQRDSFYDQYCKLSLKQAIIDIYDILFDQKNAKTDTALVISDLWEQIISVFNNNNFGQEKLLDSVLINQIIYFINSAQKNKIDLYKDQEIHLRQQLSELWSSNVYKKNINQLGINNLVETPYMTNIVVQVLPQLIEEFSSQDHLKVVFIRNIETKLKQNGALYLVELRPNEIWDLLLEYKALVDYKITNTQIHTNIISKISNELHTKLQDLIIKSQSQEKQEEYEKEQKEKQEEDNHNVLTSLQTAVLFIKSLQCKFDSDKLISVINNKQKLIQDKPIKQLLQILLYNREIIESIEQNQPTSYDFYKLFLSEYIKKQIRKLSYKQMNFQISKYLDNANDYVQNLGTLMTANQLTSIEYHQKGIVEKKSKDNLQDQIFQLFDDNADYSNIKQQIRTAIPLKVRGDSYSFFHKSIQEYLFAKSFIDLLEDMKQLKDLRIEELFLYRKQQKYNDWNYSEIKSYEDYRKQYKVKLDQVKTLIKSLEYLCNHLINQNIYQDQFFIGGINFIVNKIKQNSELSQTLITLLQISKLGNSFKNCTSNCFHIIRRSQTPIAQKDLSGIHLHKISIRNIDLQQTDLSYTIFNKVDVNGINLVDADLTHCKWQKLITNELPILNVKSAVICIAYSPNNLYIASGSEDNSIRIWDAQSGQQVGESLNGHSDTVCSVCYSPDGKFIASGSYDNSIRIWDAQSGQQIEESLNGHTDAVWSVCYSPDGKFIASGSGDNSVRIWDAQSGQQIGESLNGHIDTVLSVCYSPDGKFIASGSGDNSVRIWDAQSGQQIGESLNGHTDAVWSVCYSPDGKFIASGSEDNSVRIWDAQSGQQIGESLNGHTDTVLSVCYSPDGKFIASGSGDNSVRIWDAQSGQQIGESLNGHTDTVWSVCYSSDGKFIASGSKDNSIRIWDAQSGQQIGESLNGHTDIVWSVCYSPDGKFIASGSKDNSIRIWDAQSGQQIGESLNGHTDTVFSVCYSPDGKFIASGSYDNSIRIWDAQSGQQIGESLNGHTDAVRSVCYSPDGKFIASGSEDNSIRIWDAQSGQQIGESLNGHTDALWSVCYSPDGKFIASGSGDNSVRIWDAQSGQQIGESLNGHIDTVFSVRYSPDGKFMASGSGDKSVRIWDAQSGQQIGESLNGHTRTVFSVCYSPDGKFIASGSGDNSVRIWDAQSGQQIGESLNGHIDTVFSVCYSPDGKFMASGSGDKSVRIWDAQSGQQIREYPTQEGNTELLEKTGVGSKQWLLQFNEKAITKQVNLKSGRQDPDRLKHNYCLIRIPNSGPIMYHGCKVKEAQIESRLGINVLQLWQDRQNEIP